MQKEITLTTLADYKLLWDKLTSDEVTSLENVIVEGKTITPRFSGELRIGFRGSIIEGGVRGARMVWDAVGTTPNQYTTLYEQPTDHNLQFPPLVCALILQSLLENPLIQQVLAQLFPGGIPPLIIPTESEPPADPEDPEEEEPEPPEEDEDPEV